MRRPSRWYPHIWAPSRRGQGPPCARGSSRRRWTPGRCRGWRSRCRDDGHRVCGRARSEAPGSRDLLGCRLGAMRAEPPMCRSSAHAVKGTAGSRGDLSQGTANRPISGFMMSPTTGNPRPPAGGSRDLSEPLARSIQRRAVLRTAEERTGGHPRRGGPRRARRGRGRRRGARRNRVRQRLARRVRAAARLVFGSAPVLRYAATLSSRHALPLRVLAWVLPPISATSLDGSSLCISTPPGYGVAASSVDWTSSAGVMLLRAELRASGRPGRASTRRAR